MPALLPLLVAAALAKPGDLARNIPIDGVERTPEPPPPAANVVTAGGEAFIGCMLIDRSPVDKVIKQHINQVRYCYERRLPQRPTLEGNVTMRFVLDKDGTLLEAGVAETTLHDEVVEDCLVARFSEWEWPPGHSVYVVRYPLQFRKKPAARASPPTPRPG